MRTPTAPAARICQATKTYGGVPALRAVDLDLWPGEVHALVGQNGAGKTTVVKLLAGAIGADAGRVEVGGQALRPRPAGALALGVRCIYQSRALAANLTVADNIAMSVARGPVRHRRRDHLRARRALERLGSTLDVNRRVEALEPGEAQLVEIARALANDAVVVIMDEPTAALSQAEGTRLLNTVRSLRASGIAVLIVSHDLEDVRSVADRITVLRDGAVVLTGPTASIKRRVLVEAMLGPGTDAIDRMRDHASKLGGEALGLVGVQTACLHGIDLSLRTGELLGVTGILGSGIDDIARVASGALRPRAGILRVGGAAMRFRSPSAALAAGVACIPSDRLGQGLFPTLKTLQHIDLSRLAGSREVMLHRVRERRLALAASEQVHLAARGLDLPILALSGGHQQKVVVARVLGVQPRVLVAHEPTMGVDIGARRAIHDQLQRLSRAGSAVMLVSSDADEVAEIADRVIVVRRGSAVFDGLACDSRALAELAMGGSLVDA